MAMLQQLPRASPSPSSDPRLLVAQPVRQHRGHRFEEYPCDACARRKPDKHSLCVGAADLVAGQGRAAPATWLPLFLPAGRVAVTVTEVGLEAIHVAVPKVESCALLMVTFTASDPRKVARWRTRFLTLVECHGHFLSEKSGQPSCSLSLQNPFNWCLVSGVRHLDLG
jgi:hypothetical protein